MDKPWGFWVLIISTHHPSIWQSKEVFVFIRDGWGGVDERYGCRWEMADFVLQLRTMISNTCRDTQIWDESFAFQNLIGLLLRRRGVFLWSPISTSKQKANRLTPTKCGAIRPHLWYRQVAGNIYCEKAVGKNTRGATQTALLEALWICSGYIESGATPAGDTAYGIVKLITSKAWYLPCCVSHISQIRRYDRIERILRGTEDCPGMVLVSSKFANKVQGRNWVKYTVEVWVGSWCTSFQLYNYFLLFSVDTYFKLSRSVFWYKGYDFCQLGACYLSKVA